MSGTKPNILDGWLKENTLKEATYDPNPYNFPFIFFAPITCKKRVDSSSTRLETFEDSLSPNYEELASLSFMASSYK